MTDTHRGSAGAASVHIYMGKNSTCNNCNQQWCGCPERGPDGSWRPVPFMAKSELKSTLVELKICCEDAAGEGGLQVYRLVEKYILRLESDAESLAKALENAKEAICSEYCSTRGHSPDCKKTEEALQNYRKDFPST